MARRRTTLSHQDREILLAGLKACRQGCVRALASLPILQDDYRAVEAVMASIDDLMERLTGDRTALWNKPHSIGR